jgi:hypothetical protein
VKRIPLPISFIIVVSATVALLIFFGAWAVSADVDERDRVFAFAVPGAVSNLSQTSVNTTRAGRQSENGPPVASRTAAETWWGSGLLKACPLH